MVQLEIPARPEYVGVARLAILGVASRMRFSYDEVEDIRLAVGEACTRVIDRAANADGDYNIVLRCLIDANRLTIEVRCPSIPSATRTESRDPQRSDPLNMSDGELSGVLMRILMDEVEIEERADEGVQITRMVKYVAR